MKKLLLLVLLPVVLTTSTLNAQPNTISGIEVCEEPLTNYSIQNTFINQDNIIYVGAIGTSSVGPQVSFGIIDGTLYEDILDSNIPETRSSCTFAYSNGEKIFFKGGVNNNGGGGQARIISYNIDDLETPVDYFTIWNGASIDMITVGDYIYITLFTNPNTVMVDGYNFATGGTDAGLNTSSLANGNYNSIVRFNTVTQIIDYQLHVPIGQLDLTPRGSLTSDSLGNIYLVESNPNGGLYRINKYNPKLEPAATSAWFPTNAVQGVAQKLLVTEHEEVISLYAYGKFESPTPGESRSLRKFDSNLVEDTTFYDGTSGILFMPRNAIDMVETENAIIILANYGVISFDKETGISSPYRTISAQDDEGDFIGGSPRLSKMTYNEATQKVTFASWYSAPSNFGVTTLEGQPLPSTAVIDCQECGEWRTLKFDFDVSGVHPSAEITASVVGFPEAEITREGRTFTIANIDEQHWSNLTLDIQFVDNTGDMVIYPGNGVSLTKDFTDESLDFIDIINSGQVTYYYVNFIFRVTDGLSVDEVDTEKVRLYPNPTTGTLFVPTLFSNHSLELYDIQGKKIMSMKEMGSTIDLSNLSAGMYLAQIISDNGATQTQKIIKR